MLIIIMGVSGCGKSTVGDLLAHQTGGTFFDGDAFHTPDAVEKMRRGTPLTDSDRAGWLSRLHDLLASRGQLRSPTILACSALKESYRATLASGIVPPPSLVFLQAPFETIMRRMESRPGHFMPASLLRSQFETLEPPSDALTLDISASPESIVTEIRAHFGI